MPKYLLAALVACFLSFSVAPQSADSADASTAWNHHAATYNFDGFPGPSGVGPTFGDHYNGSDFNSDFDGILNAVASTMGTGVPPWGEGDPYSWIATNWPDS